jgi:hypothetical protein
MLTFYTNFGIPEQFAGCTRGPFVFIRPEYRNDVGLLKHEQTHVKQWFRTLGFHPLMYLLSDSYKLASEVECYKEQAKEYSDDRLPMFAVFIADKYGLNISAEDALELLRT